MIYLLAILLPPLALLLNGQPFHAIFNLVLIVICFVFGWFIPFLFLAPSAHAVIAILTERNNRKHREIVDAIRQHGAPKEWEK